jgi:preprotein translocase subunit SecG
MNYCLFFNKTCKIMKKSALFMTMVFFATSLFAPAKTFAEKKEQKKAPAKTEQVKAVKPDTPKPAEKAAVKTNAKTPEKPAVKTDKTTPAKPEVKPASSAQTKKDGTPDKRFKQNKEAAKPAVPTKKDGTPDMRYKVNKK